MRIDHLNFGEGARLRAVRLRSLDDSPYAFDTTLEEAVSQSPVFWEQQLNQFATFVAVNDGHDVGIARGSRHDCLVDAGYLISMWVAPEVRRHGIGSALVGAVVDWARSQQFKHLFLDVAELNLPAIALYTGKGFAPNGTLGTLPPPREHIREIQLAMKL